MKIGILLKQAPDTETKVKPTADGAGIETDGIKYVISPYDEYAVEEAIKTKEAVSEGEVVVVTLGPERATVGKNINARTIKSDFCLSRVMIQMFFVSDALCIQPRVAHRAVSKANAVQEPKSGCSQCERTAEGSRLKRKSQRNRHR